MRYYVKACLLVPLALLPLMGAAPDLTPLEVADLPERVPLVERVRARRSRAGR